MQRLLLGVAGAAFVAALAVAQTPVGTQVLSGNETMNIFLQSGVTERIAVGQVRNASNVATTTLATGAINLTTAVGTQVFTAALSGAVAANTPATPFDGMYLTIANGTGSAFTQTITLTATSGQTVQAGAAATMPANSSVEWQYNLANKTWYRLR